MHFDNPILFFICSIGVFNGFLASFYFLFFSKQKRVQNFFFGLLLLFLSTRIGKSVYIIFTSFEERNLLISQIGLMACFLIGAALFFYIKSSVENTKQVPKSWKWHLAILTIFIVVFGLLWPYSSNKFLWNGYFINGIYGVWGCYLLGSAVVLKDIFLKSFTKSKNCTTSEIWLIAVFVGNLLIYLAYIIGYFNLYIIGTITFSAVFYGLLIFLLFKNNRDQIFQDIPEKYGAKTIENSEAQTLVKALKNVMQREEFHKNSNIKIKDVASALGISTHKLSQLLNDNLGKSFALFINELRIEEAKQLLVDNDQYTLEAIGFEAGFSSKSTFYATFKKLTGQTPSEYKK